MSGPRVEERVWLDVPFADKDRAKAKGARWDPQVRSWYVRSGADLELFQEWLPLRWSEQDATHSCRVIGMYTRCWRCRAGTVVVVGVRLRGCRELLTFDDPLVKRIVEAVLSDEVRLRFGVGAVKRRFSKTAGKAYISNGCAQCDALQGDFMILNEELALLDAGEQREVLVVLTDAAVPTALATKVIHEFWG